MDVHVFLATVQISGLMALCSIGYRYIQSNIIYDFPRHLLIGTVMGAGAIVSMMQPFGVFNGVQIDGRNIFIAISFAFAGSFSAIVTTIYACVFSVITTGWTASSQMAITVTATTCVLAQIWAYCTRGAERKGTLAWLFLGIIVSRPLIMDVLLWHLIPRAAIVFPAITNFLCVFIFGRLFESERRRGRRERLLDAAANSDPLTGLPNRRAMMRYIQDMPSGENQDLLIMIIDIDHFKKINDTYGHETGDSVLIEVANRMRSALRESDFIARLGGEEFVILMRLNEDDVGHEIADRIRHAVSTPHPLAGTALSITASIGAMRVDRDKFDFSSIYSKIDGALYEAKRLGRNRTIFAEDSPS